MKLRNHTDQWKRDYDVQPPLTDDEQDAADTQPITPLWVADGTPAADAHIARLQEIGLLTPDVDGDDDDDAR
jgi:hypothetical protein